MPLRATYTTILKDLGFTSTRDWLSSAYGFTAYSLPLLKIQVSAAGLAAVVAFSAKWIWDPPQALAVLLVLDGLNGVYGWKVAVKVRGGKFQFSEAQRTVGKILSTLIILHLTKWSIDSYPLLKDVRLDFGMFCWLAGLKGRKLLTKMVALRLQEGGLANFIKAFITSRFGEYFVATDQGKKVPSDLSVPVAPIPDTNPPAGQE